MTDFSSLNRQHHIRSLSGGTVDLLVIGGGITGAGIALDAVSRGMRTALAEMQDFAAGTSSRSTKLVHGGLRYLKQLELGLVAEVGRERAIVHRNGQHITHPEPMLLPVIRGGSMGKTSVRVGMWLYEKLARVVREEGYRMLSGSEALAREPLLDPSRVTGGALFYEYRTDDARLTIEVLKEAVARGAVAVSYLKVTRFLYEGSRAVGVLVQDTLSGETHEIKAHRIINAAGPWSDEVAGMDNNPGERKLHITRGVHIVVDHAKLPLRQSAYFDTPDGRMVFAIPRQGKVYIGTTDTFYSGDLQHPPVTREDALYLLKAAGYLFPGSPLRIEDIESSWSGLRPLVHKPGKGPSELSRRDELFVSSSGVITIAGGKLTGYRKMAERAVDLAATQFLREGGPQFPGSVTATVRLSGGQLEKGGLEAFVRTSTVEGQKAGFTALEAELLARRYGSNVPRLYHLAEEAKEMSSKYSLPLLTAVQLLYGIREEMVLRPSDFFVRRTGDLYFRIAEVKAGMEAVIRYMSDCFGWDGEKRELYRQELQQLLEEACPFSQPL